jgi:hypothetical protein
MAKPKPIGDPPNVKLPVKEPRRDPRVQPDRRTAPLPTSPDGDPKRRDMRRG